MRFDSDCPSRHGCRPHDAPPRVPIHHRERSAEIAWRERSNGFSPTARLQRGDYSGLDQTQKQVIAVLKTTPEYWHSSVDPCSPLKDYVSVATRYAVGKALRKQSRRMESAETAPPALQK